MKHVLALWLGVVVLAGCHKSGDENAPAGADDIKGMNLSLPHLFRGTLPCADCQGIDTRLQLRADHTFIFEERYLGRQETESRHLYALGRFKQSGDTLRLDNSKRGPLFFKILNDHQLRMQDRKGQDIKSQLNYVLQTTDTPMLPTASFAMRGHYTPGDGNGFFTECESGLRWSVEGNDLAAGLTQNYTDLGLTGSAPMYAEVVAHLIRETDEDTQTPQELLVVDHVLNTAADQECAPRPM